MTRHRSYLVGAAMALFAWVAIASTPVMASPCTNLAILAAEGNDDHLGDGQHQRDIRRAGYQPAASDHRASGLLPGYRNPDPHFGFQHQDRGLAAGQQLERQVPRHGRRRVPGRDYLQFARQRHPGRFCRDQQRSRHRRLRDAARCSAVRTAIWAIRSRLRSECRRRPTTGLFGHPERIKDFGYRAIHLMTVRGKEIANLYYGQRAAKGLLRRLLHRRPERADVGAALPGRLRRDSGGRAAFNRTHLHMAGLDGVAGHPRNTGLTDPGRPDDPDQQGRAQAMRRPGWRRQHRPVPDRSARLRFRSQGAVVHRRAGPARMPDRRPGHDHAETSTAARSIRRTATWSIRAPRAAPRPTMYARSVSGFAEQLPGAGV